MVGVRQYSAIKNNQLSLLAFLKEIRQYIIHRGLQNEP